MSYSEKIFWTGYNKEKNIEEILGMCLEILYQKYTGTKVVHYDPEKYNIFNQYHLIIQQHNGQPCYVKYQLYTTSCDGFYFVLNIEFYKTIDILWDNISDEIKVIILHNIIKEQKYY
jgi:hypothetical protein